MLRIPRTFVAVAATAMMATLGAAVPKAQAQETFIGQVIQVGFTFCPRGYADANGQLLPIAQNSALFALYGTTYGGDGRTTFALPDLRGRAPIHVGQGPGLSNRQLGARGGSETNTLTAAQMPVHSHPFNATTSSASSGDASGNLLANTGRDDIYAAGAANTSMSSSSIGNVGGGQAVNNMQPFLTMRFCVALVGIFPSRN